MASRLPEPRRVIASNLPSSSLGLAEPPVGITIDKLTPISIFGGQFEKVIVGTEGTVPADNSAPIKDNLEDVPGSGIVQPGGVNVYYLDLPPGVKSPMHRTPSTDYIVVLHGTPTLVTPREAFNVAGGVGTYESPDETLINPGDVVIQRGAMHAWENRTDQWVRFLGVVLDATPQQVDIAEGQKTEPLVESWLQ